MFKKLLVPKVKTGNFSRKDWLRAMFIVVGVSASHSALAQATEPATAPQEVTQTATEKVITGKVLSVIDNNPVVGALVFIKGTNIATETDENGSYTITVPKENLEGILVVQNDMFQSEELPIATTTSFDVKLLENITDLMNVQIIGYGTQEKSDVTGAISSVKSDDIARVVVADAGQALQGRVTGVNVTQNTGAPGSPLTIQVRGVGTIGNSSPLYVVDDVPVGDISYLNQNDIESIDILKDASSAAVYGARAANGVVLITTKKGNPKKPAFEFNYLTGSSRAWKTVDMLDAKEWTTLKNEALVAAGKAPIYNPDNYGTGTDWQREIFRNAKMNSYQLAAHGGTEKLDYYVSGGYLNQQGIVKGSGYERFNLNTNANYKATKRLSIGSFMNVATSERRIVNDEGMFESVISNALKADPLASVYSGRSGDSLYAPNNTNDGRNPLAIIAARDSRDKVLNFIGRWYGEYKIINGLKAKTSVSYYTNNKINNKFEPSFFVKNAASQFRSDTNRAVSREVSNNNQITWENSLSYEKTIKEKHNFGALVLMGIQKNRNEYFAATKRNLPSNNYSDQFFDQATVLSIMKGNGSENALLSYMARINYEYDNKYLFTANLRADGSSRFPSNNRWGRFPSFAAGWKFSEESFFQSLKKYVSFGKLRASWGKLGNQNIGYTDYPYTTNITAGQNYTFNDVIVYGSAPKSNANANVTWEKVTTSNIGLDLGFFNNKLLFSADYFTRETKDMLINKNVSSIAGYEDAPVVNAGTMMNKGLELMLELRNKETKVKYSVAGNITFIKNKVTSMNSPILGEAITNNSDGYVQITQQGLPVAQFYGYQVDHVIQTETEAAQLRASGYQTQAHAGDFKFKDVNGDGKLDANDRTIIGSPLPKFTFGLNSTASYRNFDIVVFLQGVYGNKIYNGGKMNYGSSDFSYNYGKYAELLNRWTGENSSTVNPRVVEGDPNQNGRVSDYFVESGSYLRIKNIQIGYTIPKVFTDKWKMQDIRFFVASQNLLTFTKYSGLDPEIGRSNYNFGNGTNYPNPLEIGVDRGGTYPQARTWQFGINAKF